MRRLGFIFASAILAGCAQIVTVKPTTPQFTATGNQASALAGAEDQLREAAGLKESNPLQALGLAHAISLVEEYRQLPL